MKVALITGGSGGIGKSIAIKFLEQGYSVSVTGRSLIKLQESFEGIDGNILLIQANAEDFDSYQMIIDKTIAKFGQLDCLVNNVGGGTLGKTIEKTTKDDWNSTFNLNTTSVFFTIQAALPYLTATKGSIINFSSILASRPVNGLGPYSAAKSAVEILNNTDRPSLLRNTPIDTIDSKAVFEAAIAGDEVAKEVFEYTGRILGISLANFVMFSSPEAIILFGGLTKAGDLILKPTREHMEANLIEVFQNKIKILVSHLKESDAAILGASALMWD
jgi:NADP-dependent 3-hydroxy acid dehydrogenase YdfG